MRWSTLALVGIGVVAAVCAAVLVASLAVKQKPPVVQASTSKPAPEETTVVKAAANLEEFTPLERKHLDVEKVRVDEAPAKSFTNPMQLIGRVLKDSVKAGQALKESDLLDPDSSAAMLTDLDPGKVRFAIPIQEPGMEASLYPGCLVDVLATFRPVNPGGRPVSTVLLKRVKVLDVNRRSADKGGASRQPWVGLMVDHKEAQELQLGLTYGTLALVQRKPLDNTDVETRAALLEVGVMESARKYRKEDVSIVPAMAEPTSTTEEPATSHTPPAAANTGAATSTTKPAPTVAATTRPAEVEAWDVEFIRGDKAETKSFSLAPELRAVLKRNAPRH